MKPLAQSRHAERGQAQSVPLGDGDACGIEPHAHRLQAGLGRPGAVLQSNTSLRVLHATSFHARLLGLLALPRLQPGEALVLKPCASVHTCFMRYAIDVLYLDRDGVVLKVVPALAPWRFSACLGARSTLELAAGEAERLGLRPGSRIDPN